MKYNTIAYAILNCQKNGDTEYFGVRYNTKNEASWGYQAATFADEFENQDQMMKWADENDIVLS